MLKQRLVSWRRGRLVVVAAALAAVVGVGAAGVEGAQRQELPAFGMVGLARGQVAVLNLVDVGTPGGRDACRVTAAFVDETGQVLHDRAGNPVQQTFLLRPNVAVALRLRAEDILGNGQARRTTRVVLADPGDDVPSNCGCLVANRELVAANGITLLDIYGKPPGGGGNPPPPPFCEQFISPSR